MDVSSKIYSMTFNDNNNGMHDKIIRNMFVIKKNCEWVKKLGVCERENNRYSN